MHSIYSSSRHFSDNETPLIMGVLNVTPDSFSDGSRYNRVDLAKKHAVEMIESGVDIIDVGGESTRPGAADVSISDEIDRVVPVIAAINALGVAVSIDTSKPEVMIEAVNAGASMINDVRALQAEKALQTAANLQVPVCLMHMQGKPRTMQASPEYQNVVGEVTSFLQHRVEACENAGIARELICLDPGFGFGKTLQHNLLLLNQLEQLTALGFPLLVGMSRKSMLGEISGKPVEQRLAASLAVSHIAMQKGARIVRVHDVSETHDVRQVFMALKQIK
jgi:dihydropteroate synthase